ncbi:hypothetical protein Aple_089170 [Acrocarpospora pleiomorpha]|uniref:Uncharacterized protein n=1 Tax=Acrocarpospora pleiomorpha TaxID=90975 RepID=A0A5M3Y4S2_9ACTN|nr:hypothetical protein [Acrocarpospora pleiomorpha]GES26018.1 hypothetical protein Aple_089170 [Acrocarpospora pleiomorpha]
MDEQTLPKAGMTISVRTRRDVVIMDPARFMTAARTAYRDLHPDVSEEAAAESVTDVYDAVNILLDRLGRLTADAPEMPIGRDESRRGHRVLDRPDGLSPAGEIHQIVLNDPRPLQDYGCFLPEDPFALPSGSTPQED